MNKQMRLLVLAVTIALIAPMLAVPEVASAAEVMQRAELYFGTARPDGTVVTDAEFGAFVDSIVTPRFPGGVTVLNGVHQSQNAANVILKERVFQMILVAPLSMRDTNRKIEEIRSAYRQRFLQESVVRVDSLVSVSL